MSGFTKGPWHLEGPSFGFGSIVSDDGSLIFGIAAGGPDECQDETTCNANARLIAAAPELLEALEGLERWFDTDPEIIAAMSDHERTDHNRQLRLIRAAIAKARGAA